MLMAEVSFHIKSNRTEKGIFDPDPRDKSHCYFARPMGHDLVCEISIVVSKTSKTPYVAIDERGLVRSIHLFLFPCVH